MSSAIRYFLQTLVSGKASPSEVSGVSKGGYGDGSDGNVTISGTTTLTRDMYYNNLTITGSGILQPDGSRIFVKGTLTNASGGKIRCNGGNASGTAGGSGTNSNTLPGGAVGATCTSVLNGDNGTGTSNSLGGNGGNGGNGTGTTGGTGGVASALATDSGSIRHFPACIMGKTSSFNNEVWVTPGAGGAAGGGDGASNGGGGGGGGGGVIVIAADTIVNNGSIEALGGTGATGPAAGTGGGGGGGGGVILLTYGTYSGSGTLSAAGGSNGVGGAGGSAGIIGTAGTIIQIVN